MQLQKRHIFYILILNKFLPCAGCREEEEKLKVCSPEHRFSQMNISLCSLFFSSGHPLFTWWLCGCVLRRQTCVFASKASAAAEAYPLSADYCSIKKVTLVQQKAKSKSGGLSSGVQSAALNITCIHREECSSLCLLFNSYLDSLIYFSS